MGLGEHPDVRGQPAVVALRQPIPMRLRVLFFSDFDIFSRKNGTDFAVNLSKVDNRTRYRVVALREPVPMRLRVECI